MLKKNILLFAILLLNMCSAVASDTLCSVQNNLPFSLSLELSTKYMWRAIEYGDAPTSFAIINYEHRGFSAYAEGVYAINGSHSEVDLGVSYNYKWLTFGINDYYYPSSIGKKDKYFKLSSYETSHYLEGTITIQPTKVPVWLTLSNYFWGADKNLNGRQAFSSYAEIGYNHKFNENNNICLAIGTSINKGFYTDYESGFNVVNITAKYATNFKFGKFFLPVSASYILNPYRNKSYVTLSVYFNSKL